MSEGEAVATTIVVLARERAEEILEDARRRAEEILEDARRQAREIIEMRRKKAEAEAKEEAARKRSAAEVKARKIVMEAEKECLEEFRRRVLEEIRLVVERRHERYDYREVLRALIGEGLRAMRGRASKVYVLCRREDRGIVEEIISGIRDVEVILDEASVPIMGGVILRNEDDTVRYYNTLEGRVERILEEKASELMRELIGR
ncbi:MAG: hypothetical protein DRO06_03155 [Thermoproteota archaeon]|nr:MAG: hypothetical protein DRO06_03155 [Candidatus Korarchaeota archaeon]